MTAAPELVPQSATDGPAAGDTIGNYQLLCSIARGGMGQVWAGRQIGRLGLPRLVAIKTALPQSPAAHDVIQQSLFDEARVAASIDHPNVCRILELGEERGVLFIVMEWIFGVPLSMLLTALGPKRRLDCHVAAELVAQACAGLHAAHELRDEDGELLDVVHRDATPQNLIVSYKGEVKVVDFGIVKSKNQLHQATEAGELKGKIAYLSPEQLGGKPIDRRADIFALGCVLYLATTGQRPFTGNDMATIITQILKGVYALPSAVVAGYPPELEAIVCRALATDPNDRFATAEQMRNALIAFVETSPTPMTRERIATLVNDLCGRLIEHRRELIRSAQKSYGSEHYAQSGTYPVHEATPSRAAFSALSSTSQAVQPPAPEASPANLPESGAAARFRRFAWILGGLGAFGGFFAFALLSREAPLPAAPPDAARPAGANVGKTQTRTPTAAKGEAAPRQITITVETDPPDAVVQLDDAVPTTAPLNLTLSTDDRVHRLRLTANGYEVIQQSIRFDQSRSLFFKLVPTPKKSEGRFVRRTVPHQAPRAAAPAPEPSQEPQLKAAPAAPAAPATTNPAPTRVDPFSEPLRVPPRHAIDERDPFRP